VSPLTRRRLLTAGMGTLAAASLAGCDALSTAPASGRDDRSVETAGTGMEAPSRAAMVAAGDLPRLEESRHDGPAVGARGGRPGDGGGERRRGLGDGAEPVGRRYLRGYYKLVRWWERLQWSAELKDVIPNLAHRLEQKTRGTEYDDTVRT